MAAQTLGEKLRMLRKNRGWTLEEAAKVIGTSKGLLGKYEIGMIQNLKRPTLERLADVFEVSPEYLLGWDDNPFAYKNIERFDLSRTIPLLGTIACGKPIMADENFEGAIPCESSLHVDFALRAHGDSMVGARIYEGDLVYVRAQDDVENGEIAAVLIDNEATLKRVYKLGDTVELRAENPMYRPIVLGQEYQDRVRIIGKAIAFLSGIV